MTREERDARAAAAHPIGSTVTTRVHSIGGRSELVTGPVVEIKRGQLIVATDSHGRLAVGLDRVTT